MRPSRRATIASTLAPATGLFALATALFALAGCGERKATTTGEPGAGASETAGAQGSASGAGAPGPTGAVPGSAAPAESASGAAAAGSGNVPVGGPGKATLVAAGDACFGRLVGQEILKNPSFNPFTSSERLLRTADLRFVNMESQLSDQKGETQSPTQKLVFTGPPGGADALARGRIDVVSAANNHMWDYGEKAFFETLDNLERAGVKYAGAGRTRERAYAPEIVQAGGLSIAFLAFTDIWNQGSLKYHAAKDHVAEAGREAITSGVAAARARADVDVVVVSYHGGEEYVGAPLQRAIDLHRAAIDAGADAVLGHHPHVTQGIEIYKQRPIFYSLGNYLMRIHGTHLETEIGFFANITFAKGTSPKVRVCPFRIPGVVPAPVLLADDPRRDLYERIYRQRFRVVQGSIAAPAVIGATAEDGCSDVSAP